MTRKILAVVLSLTAVASLTSCGKSSKEDNTIASEDSSVTDIKKDDSESSAQDKSTADESEIESESSAGAGVGENTGYVITDAVPGTDMTVERPAVFEDNYWITTNHFLREYTAANDNNLRFHIITNMCDEYNELTVDACNPDSWFKSIQDQLAESIDSIFYFEADGDPIVNSQELVEVNGRTFVKFDITSHDKDTDKDVVIAGYITVVQDANIEDYENGNTVGFMITTFADTADKAFIDEALNHAAETLVVK